MCHAAAGLCHRYFVGGKLTRRPVDLKGLALSQARRRLGADDYAANGQNPLPIVIPCHRVIGANGKMTGFGGGIPVKEALLALESKQGTLRNRLG